MKSLVIAILLIAGSCDAASGRISSTGMFILQEQDKQDIFASIRSSLPGHTAVPVRLPAFLPVEKNSDGLHVHAIVEMAELHGYEIQLAWTEDCGGGNYCHYGAIRGSHDPLAEENRKKVSVTLNGGINGYFIPFVCGAHCGDSSIGWSENGYHYSISLKAENRKTMIRVANSALMAGRTAKLDSDNNQ